MSKPKTPLQNCTNESLQIHRLHKEIYACSNTLGGFNGGYSGAKQLRKRLKQLRAKLRNAQRRVEQE
jgi:hypothetical protein